MTKKLKKLIHFLSLSIKNFSAKDFTFCKHNLISTSSGSMTFPAVESNLLGWKRPIVPRIICHRIPS